MEAKPNTNRCPLCHMNIREDEKAWRNHLMGVDGCIKNPRRNQALKKSKFYSKISLKKCFFFYFS